MDNLDLVNYWTKEISQAKKFYDWFQTLTTLRYDTEIQQTNPHFVQKYDFIIDNIISVAIPECDLDQYSTQLKIDVNTYAKNMAKSFQEDHE